MNKSQKSVKPIPDGYHAITPYLIVNDAAAAIHFYRTALGASELLRMPAPNGKIAHAEIRIGDSVLMLADEHPDIHAFGPKHYGGSPMSLMLYVEDVDAVINGAVKAGATLVRPIADQFYGDRSGIITDPFGHNWFIATHIEDVSPEELARRSADQGTA
ncbi:VOC family protein [Permianibacter sp. IMCC34836]|uniref:VOC family protein n=1 Tax=Permianibacter fluminis TaxID=2738515 RepID=UPI00155350A7|nr:VOC family protein [Permianibacter fluminis]NQD37584.1 VOC family protein [Permianibacter fluminis]